MRRDVSAPGAEALRLDQAPQGGMEERRGARAAGVDLAAGGAIP